MPSGIYDRAAFTRCHCGGCPACFDRQAAHRAARRARREHLGAQKLFADTGALWFLDHNVLQSQLNPRRFGADF